jgi:two-component system nitrogen regulation sensor histidine kinase NtrY
VRTPHFYVGAELFAVSVMLGTAAMTYMSLSRQDNSSALLSPPVVALLLIANLVPAIALLVLLGRRVAMRGGALRRSAATASCTFGWSPSSRSSPAFRCCWW